MFACAGGGHNIHWGLVDVMNGEQRHKTNEHIYLLCVVNPLLQLHRVSRCI